MNTHIDTRPLKTRMMEAAKRENGQVAHDAVLTAAKHIGIDHEHAKKLAAQAMMDSLIRPIVESSYSALSEADIDMLASGEFHEWTTAGLSNTSHGFDPWARKVNFSILLPMLYATISPCLTQEPSVIGLAAGGFLLGLKVAWPQIVQTINGLDAEVVLILMKTSKTAATANVLLSKLLIDVNNERIQRGDPLLSQADFDQSVLRLIAAKFIKHDSLNMAVSIA